MVWNNQLCERILATKDHVAALLPPKQPFQPHAIMGRNTDIRMEAETANKAVSSQRRCALIMDASLSGDICARSWRVGSPTPLSPTAFFVPI